MSMGVTEMAVQAVVHDGLENLRKNHHHLEFILNRYNEIPYVQKRVGGSFIKNAMEAILRQDLVIRPFYTENIDQYPCLVLVTSYSEGTKFIGDYGHTVGLGDEGLSGTFETKPVIYAKFDCYKISGDTMVVPAAYNLASSLWLGVWVVCGKAKAQVLSARETDEGTILTLSATLPARTPLKGWTVQTIPSAINAVINASHNTVDVQLALYTTGDPELHRIWAQVIRYCLKRGRKLLEQYGVQNANISQQPMLVADADSLVFRTTYTLTAEELDTWIERDFSQTERISLEIEAEGQYPEREKAVRWTE